MRPSPRAVRLLAYRTTERGRRCFEQVTGRIADFLVELAAADLDELYE